MSTAEPGREPLRTRREPPPFRRVEVRRAEPLSPRLVRVTLGGPELEGLVVDEPAASVRLLLPNRPGEPLIVPEWKGNEFLLPDGRRPAIRTLTPRRFDPVALELAVDTVVHAEGLASRWATTAAPGMQAAVSGPGRGYTIDADAPAFLLAGDESAIPAISQLLEALPRTKPVQVLVEVAAPDARLPLPAPEAATVEWYDLAPGSAPGDALLTALRAAALPAGVRVWAAGEAAGVQRIRRYLFEERGMDRTQTTIRGYWKLGRAGTGES